MLHVKWTDLNYFIYCFLWAIESYCLLAVFKGLIRNIMESIMDTKDLEFYGSCRIYHRSRFGSSNLSYPLLRHCLRLHPQK